MTLAINIMDGCGISDKVHHKHLLMEDDAVLVIHSIRGGIPAFQGLYTSSKAECFSCKGEWVYT